MSTHDALCAKFREIRLDDKSTDHFTSDELQLYRIWLNGWDCGSEIAFDRAKALALGAGIQYRIPNQPQPQPANPAPLIQWVNCTKGQAEKVLATISGGDIIDCDFEIVPGRLEGGADIQIDLSGANERVKDQITLPVALMPEYRVQWCKRRL